MKRRSCGAVHWPFRSLFCPWPGWPGWAAAGGLEAGDAGWFAGPDRTDAEDAGWLADVGASNERGAASGRSRVGAVGVPTGSVEASAVRVRRGSIRLAARGGAAAVLRGTLESGPVGAEGSGAEPRREPSALAGAW
jgi:hypothetical protein